MSSGKQAVSEFVHQGWRKKQIPVPRALDDPAIIEVLCSPLGSFSVDGLIDTPEHFERGSNLCWTYSARSIRTIVPGKYTHVELQPAHSKSSLPTRCKVRFIGLQECRELLTSTAGENWDVLRYQGPPATAVLEFSGLPHDYREVQHFSFDGTRSTELVAKRPPFRGLIRIPGPGLIQINREGSWSLALRPQARQ